MVGGQKLLFLWLLVSMNGKWGVGLHELSKNSSIKIQKFHSKLGRN